MFFKLSAVKPSGPEGSGLMNIDCSHNIGKARIYDVLRVDRTTWTDFYGYLSAYPSSFNIHMLLIISYQNKSLPIEKMDRSFGFCLFFLFRWFSAFKILISYDKNKDDKGAKIKTRIGGRHQATTHQITFSLSLPV